LPSARLLARNLNVNRNTVLRAYSVLGRDGYVEGRRGAGTTVKHNPGEDLATDRPSVGPTLARLLDELVVEGETLGLSADDLAALVNSHASMRETRLTLRIVFVECNPQSLAHFVRSIERLGVHVEGVLLDDLIEELQSGRLDDVDAFASTFFHLSEVRRYLRDAGYDHELFAVGVRPHVSVLNALDGLEDGSRVGVVYYAAPDDAYAPARLRRMSEAIELGLPNLEVVPLLLTELPTESVFSALDAVVVRPENIAPVRSAIPRDATVIDFVNQLDEASRRFLEEVFDDLRSRGPIASTASSTP
jgi:GntR family transcriptional regulator